MCTILSFDYNTFTSNQDAIIKRIREDFVRNSHGNSLILASSDPKKSLVLQTLDLDTVITVLTTVPFLRFWLHLRHSTTATQGLAGCHAFTPNNGWYVMHNGILREGQSNKLPVDSQAISELLRYTDTRTVTEHLLKNETYANVFMIQPEKGKWTVCRSKQGTLFWDGIENFSSNPIPTLCETPFLELHFIDLTFTIDLPKYVPAYPLYNWKNWQDDDWYERNALTKTTVLEPIKNTTYVETDWGAVTDEELIDWDKEGIIEYPDWFDIFYEKQWDVNGVPDIIKKSVTAASKRHLKGLVKRKKFA